MTDEVGRDQVGRNPRGANDATIRTDPGIWDDLARPLPDWFRRAKLGIFVHWGPYSVPAWGEPTGELGTVDGDEWFAHNPYAEWYANSIRIEGCPAAEHHQQMYGGAPYDDFLDAWDAASFDAGEWARTFRDVGADYVVLTTKHHDGVALWDAPGTGDRNTVHRGPRRDLVGELAAAAREVGLRFGVYYSGGLDWHVTDLPPHTDMDSVKGTRPLDAAYNAYAALHVHDLIDRYRPDILWNDIEWPDAGKRTGTLSLHELFRTFYTLVPEGVVNDRWGDTHRDFRTSEYQSGRENEAGEPWEHTRGLGLSFGYNQVEDASHTLSGDELARHLADVVSRGGRFLLNVGPTARGSIPDLQAASLHGLGRWNRDVADLLRDAVPVASAVAVPSDDPWLRWVSSGDELVAFVADPGRTVLRFDSPEHDASRASLPSGDGSVRPSDDGLVVEVTATHGGPAVVVIPRR